ncbi:MAG: hypothetical protein Q7J32_01585, partial [Sphingomonadaceae bacterium]|nr:hypothetical protein [Sphingomonadaceae bacterium]
ASERIGAPRRPLRRRVSRGGAKDGLANGILCELDARTRRKAELAPYRNWHGHLSLDRYGTALHGYLRYYLKVIPAASRRKLTTTARVSP